MRKVGKMTVLNVLKYPHPHLRVPTKTVKNISDLAVQNLIDNMIDTMYEYDGVGLAANQVASDQSIIVYDYSGEKTDPQVLINPEIIGKGKGIQKSTEGCLCIPGVFVPINRHMSVIVKGYTRDGKEIEITAENQLANILQHEIDHLKGVLFIDHLSKMQRKVYKKRLGNLI